MDTKVFDHPDFYSYNAFTLEKEGDQLLFPFWRTEVIMDAQFKNANNKLYLRSSVYGKITSRGGYARTLDLGFIIYSVTFERKSSS